MKFTGLLIIIVAFLVGGCAIKQYGSSIERLMLVYDRVIEISEEEDWVLATITVNIPFHPDNIDFWLTVSGQPVQGVILTDTDQEVWEISFPVARGVWKVRVELWTDSGIEFDWDGLLWVQ